MNRLIELALTNKRTTLATLALILIVGLITFRDIPKESDPDVKIPIIYVALTLDGISPEDAERLLVRPFETQLRSIEGIKEMRSSAYEGGANIVMEFEAGFNSTKAMADVRRKTDLAKPDLPPTTKEPIINEVAISEFPVLVVTLSGSVPERTLIRLARDLKERIEANPAVLRAEIAGNRDETVEIVVDPMRMESYGLDAVQIISALTRSNRLVPAGSLDVGHGRFAIKVPGVFENVPDILAMPVKVRGDAVVRIVDIADVRRGFKDRESIARMNGQPAVAVEVSKRVGQNIIQTIEGVKQVVEGERARWPEAVTVTYSNDQSKNIKVMLADLTNNAVSGVILVMIVVVGALGIRSGLLVGVAIPGSFLLGILVLAAMGFTVNVVVLFGLILAVGMLVDDAIVLNEYADKLMAEGYDREEAYRGAAKRMAPPIIGSTLTKIVVFMPLLLWPGVVGQFMKYLPVTVIALLAASLAMALLFIPALASVVGRRSGAGAGGGHHDIDTAFRIENLKGLTGLYVRVLSKALDHPGKVLLLAIALLVGVQAAYAMKGRGVEFFPKIEPERSRVLVHARGNLSIREKLALAVEVEDRIRPIGEFKSVYTSVGSRGQGGQEVAEDVVAVITLEFKDWGQRRPAKEITQDVLRRTADLAGIWVEAADERKGPAAGKPIHIEFSAREPDLLPAEVAKARAHLETMTGLVNVEDSRPVPGIEWRVAVDRAQAAKFGVDVSLVGSYIQLVTRGLKLTDYRPNDADKQVDIVVRYPESDRSVGQLDDIRIQTEAGLVPIGNFVSRTAAPLTTKVNRVDGRRVLTVKADVAPGVLADDKVREIRAWIDSAKINPEVAVRFKGEDKEQKAAASFLSRAFMAALFLIAVILLAQFNSFYSTLLILSAVIMSTIGVFLGLLATGQAFGIVMGGIGVIALAGIIVNNNIILIDTYDRLKGKVPTVREALIRTGAQRLRPVVLTAMTAVLGLLPLMFQVNLDIPERHVSVGAPSTQWWTQIATAIVFGLTFATVLTLIVTPSALMWKANLGAWVRRMRGRSRIAAIAVEGPTLKAAE
ncbi:MAG: efflux RND transporter permease subunit [Alphaproteobacteria bacterium]|nr:efflux RND transporter permease subunit [Alphaproteobacteria bacterium]